MGFCFDFQGKAFGPVDNGAPLFCIAGPCALESRAHALEVAAALKEIFAEAGVSFLYKSSFDKANRSSGSSFRGVGMAEGLSILAEVRESVGVPVLTDVHTPEQAAPVAEVADMLQTPAFLCRQTDLIAAVAATGKPVKASFSPRGRWRTCCTRPEQRATSVSACVSAARALATAA